VPSFTGRNPTLSDFILSAASIRELVESIISKFVVIISLTFIFLRPLSLVEIGSVSSSTTLGSPGAQLPPAAHIFTPLGLYVVNSFLMVGIVPSRI
jgi:hypothetical protein